MESIREELVLVVLHRLNAGLHRRYRPIYAELGNKALGHIHYGAALTALWSHPRNSTGAPSQKKKIYPIKSSIGISDVPGSLNTTQITNSALSCC